MLKLRGIFSSLGSEFYKKVTPDPLINPHLVHFNAGLARELSLDELSIDWVSVLSGKSKPDSAIATLYAGHQFGVWNPQLGDGRAMLIAEHIDKSGTIWELQTKGSGITPFSRNADGRAVLRSSIREYLCSHAMKQLGVPTTLALAIVGSDNLVYREHIETAAVVMRVAQSFIRFGHFEIFASLGQKHNLHQLMQHVLQQHYPEFLSASNPFLAMFEEIVRRTAYMIAKWQALGFCHGVMNTDNMSILGLTLDYGPFGFMEKFNPSYICNHSDHHGRYCYANQPHIAWWNLQRLAETYLPYLTENDLSDVLNKYASLYNQYYVHEMGNKLGIPDFSLADLGLLNELIEILAEQSVDWTIFWRQFSYCTRSTLGEKPSKVTDAIFTHDKFILWLNKYNARQQTTAQSRSHQLMLDSNPALVPRNYMLQNAIIKAQDADFSEVERLFRAVSEPFKEFEEFADYYDYPPDSADQIILSCSS